MHIAIAGASGLIGTALTAELRRGGHTVTAIERDGHRPRAEALEQIDLDALVNLAGAGIGDKRWTPARRAEIRDSRVEMTAELARYVAARRVPLLVNASAVGIYGDRGDRLLDERSSPGTGFLAEVCQAWELATRPARDAGARVVLARSGVVFSARGGALAKQLRLFRLGLGGRLGSGRQWVSWSALDDHVRALVHLLGADVEGPVNVVAPDAVRNETLTRVLAAVLHRPAVLAVPAAVARLALGQLADELVLASQRVSPSVLRSSGFRWEHNDLRSALESITGRAGR